MADFTIAHVYPDEMNTGGDGGNVLCLQKRLEWRGISCAVERVSPGDRPDLTAFDLLYIGGGQDFDRKPVLADLVAGLGQELRAAIADGKAFFCTGGGFQLMGQYFETQKKEKIEMLGAADFHTIEGANRLIGNMAFALEEDLGNASIVGFENHGGRTYLGTGVKALGAVLVGHGNNGEDKTEGARFHNVFCTYAHGPALPKNPALADALLARALEQKTGGVDLAPLDDAFENATHDAVLAATLAGTLGKDA